MGKKSFLDKIRGKKAEKTSTPPSAPVDANSENQEVADETVDHLWMKEDLDAEKPKLERNPKIDTAILRNRIADKLAKTGNS